MGRMRAVPGEQQVDRGRVTASLGPIASMFAPAGISVLARHQAAPSYDETKASW